MKGLLQLDHIGHSTAPIRGTARRAFGKVALALFVLFLCAAIGPQSPSGASATVSAGSSGVALRVDSSFAFADLDGDRQPDLATAEIEHADSHLTHYLIRLRLKSSSGAGQSIGITGSFGLPQISALDVNGDHVPDLVVTAPGQQRPIAVLLNDGRGRFSVAKTSDFASFLAASPWSWNPASGHLQDTAVLVLSRAPQAEAPKSRQSFASGLFSTASNSVYRGFSPHTFRSTLLGRAPPLFS